MKSGTDTGLIVLAAGASRRLGQPKQLVLHENKPLLQHILDVGQKMPVCERLLVLGAHFETIVKKIDPTSFRVIQNPAWEEGMSTSIHLGLKTLVDMNPAVKHALFVLSDQPFLTPSILDQLMLSQDDQLPCITTCTYANQMGVPAIFSHHFFDELYKLKGDQGARKLMKQHLAHVRTVPFSKGAVDIDTPEDLENLT